MNARELRRKYIDFFREKGGQEFPSASLVPIDVLGNEDLSLLFNSAGMVQFKPYFLGVAQPPKTRLVTAQKCLRTTDIESVGDTSHLTFFEMLGNFSFGDYFKKEAIQWAWEFLIDRLKLDANRLRVTVFQDDDEAFGYWHEMIGLPEERISRFDEHYNYWPGGAISNGPNGPCGPCSEIYYDLKPELPFDVDWDGEGDRWLEIWNLVFMQFERSGDFVVDNEVTKEGHWENVKLTPLPKQNIDTGMGLERTSAALSGFTSVYETDVLAPIIQRIENLSGRSFKTADTKLQDVFRIIADHIRSATFCIADGVQPSNSDRGYVLRRLIRRAVLKGQRQLGFDKPFFAEVFPAVEQVLTDQYPELTERREFIIRTLQTEEEQFRSTLAEGIRRAEGLALTGRDAFMLYDTYGFPLEVTMELAGERGVTVDLEEFNSALEEQRQRSKAAGGLSENVFSKESTAVQSLVNALPPTRFIGYEGGAATGKVLGIVVNGAAGDNAAEGDRVELALDQSPFYAESGGPVGDTGEIVGPNGTVIVEDTQKITDRWVHIGRVKSGRIAVGETVNAAVDMERRKAIMRNHTATHLLHAALRQVLGGHVHQAGSLVHPDYLRFDFTHNKGMTEQEMREVEQIVNRRVLEDLDVVAYTDLPISEAKAKGAMALFGEKYGDKVRMIEISEYSRELCGGIHLAHTSQIGLFKIVSEGSVASGVRRIEAVTGAGVLTYLLEREHQLKEAAKALKTSPNELPNAVERLHGQVKALEKRLQALAQSQAAAGADVQQADIDGVKLVVRRAENTDAKTAGVLADRLAEEHKGAVVLVGAAIDGKVVFIAKVAPDAASRGVHAGNLVREVAKIAGGSGGGRPDFAQAGGKDPAKLEEALSAAAELVKTQLK